MVEKDWVPERGDIIWINCDPRAGHEQGGGRRALVLSPATYNDLTSLAVLLPITTQVKKYPFELGLPSRMTSKGVILCDHVKNFDWRARKASFKEKVPDEIVEQAIGILDTLLR